MAAVPLPGRVRRSVKAALPPRISDAIRVGLGRASVAPANGKAARPGGLYEETYEHHARSLPPESSIGNGDYALVGRIELSALIQEGLTPSSALLDFGCGTGRLAVHAIPYLSEGRYIGTDISPTMLTEATRKLPAEAHACSIEWQHQPTPVFPLPDDSVDFLCAYSVFTHMDHEDCFRYLRSARRVVRRDGRVLASVLPIHLDGAQRVFRASAKDRPEARWSKVRNVTTSVELMETVAGLAGWRVVRWHDGDKASIRLVEEERLVALGQSILVLEHAD